MLCKNVHKKTSDFSVSLYYYYYYYSVINLRLNVVLFGVAI